MCYNLHIMKSKMIFALVLGALVLPAIALAQFTAPTGQPPEDNPPGPVWIYSVNPSTAQTGSFYINGRARAGNLYGNSYVISGGYVRAGTYMQINNGDLRLVNGDVSMQTSGKAIRADGDGTTVLNVGNWGSGSPTGFTMGVYGNLNILGYASAGGTLSVEEVCLDGDCRTTWPSTSVTDQWVNTTGDAMTGTLTITPAGSVTALLVNGGDTAFFAEGAQVGGHFRSEEVLGSRYADVYLADTRYANSEKGIFAQGRQAGGYFQDVGDSGIAYVGYGDLGIDAKGNLAGGHFTDANNSPTEAYAAYGTQGIYAVGTGMGGNFADTDGTSQAYIGYSTYGVYAVGDNMGVYGNGGNYGLYGNGGTYGMYAIGGTYGVLGRGDTGGYFMNAANTTIRTYLGHADGPIVTEGGNVRIHGGNVNVYNPTNDTASVNLGWKNDQARIRYGGTGDGSGAGVEIQGTGDEMKAKFYNDGDFEISGSVATKSAGTTWAVSSDIRLKNVLGTYDHGLDEISKLTPIVFSFKEGNARGIDSADEYVGFSAQDVESVIPEAVYEEEDGYKSLDSDPILWAMVNAIKELKAENDDLRARVEALEAN